MRIYSTTLVLSLAASVCSTGMAAEQAEAYPRKPIRVIVQADSFVSMMQIDYHDGERYPALERVDGAPSYLDDIIKPLTTPEKAPEQKKDEAE